MQLFWCKIFNKNDCTVLGYFNVGSITENQQKLPLNYLQSILTWKLLERAITTAKQLLRHLAVGVTVATTLILLTKFVWNSIFFQFSTVKISTTALKRFNSCHFWRNYPRLKSWLVEEEQIDSKRRMKMKVKQLKTTKRRLVVSKQQWSKCWLDISGLTSFVILKVCFYQ